MASFQVTELMVSLADCPGENTVFCDGDSHCPGGTHPCNQATNCIDDTQCLPPTDCPGENTAFCPGDSHCAGGTHPCNQGTNCIDDTQCIPATDCPGENTVWCDGDSNCPGGTHPCNQGTELPDETARESPRELGGAVLVEPPELSELRILLDEALAAAGVANGA
jgi:hypothetical protein